MSHSLVVKVTVGPERLEAMSQALTVSATALASGVPVSVWLTGDATYLATPGYAEKLALPHAAPFSDLRDALLAAEAVTVCTQCAARRGLEPGDLLSGARIAGAAALVEEVLADGAQALVY
ncbi:MAG: DsrE family protein [Dermatophilaceae bacterium]